MRVAVIGGGLQGIEAAYLTRKAGWQVLLIDRKPSPPAIGLADDFVQLDVISDNGFGNVVSGADLILPALEDTTALECLAHSARSIGIPFVFDAGAYAVSSSKLASNRLFERLQLPMPLPWPQCDLPLLVKPAQASGSRGVRFFGDAQQFKACFPGNRLPDGWVLQEYLPGSLHSLEVIGRSHRYRTLQATDLAMDGVFDCKRVLAPSSLPADLVSVFEQMALKIAGAIQLNGIMDIEVVRCGGILKVLEIDARLPSQTPVTVFWSSGVNMVQVLGELFCGRRNACPEIPATCQGAILEHVRLSGGLLEIGGEHLMTTGGPLHIENDFFGADEAITNRRPGQSEWVAALIVKADDRAAAWRRRNQVIEQIMANCRVKQYLDFEPTQALRK